MKVAKDIFGQKIKKGDILISHHDSYYKRDRKLQIAVAEKVKETPKYYNLYCQVPGKSWNKTTHYKCQDDKFDTVEVITDKVLSNTALVDKEILQFHQSLHDGSFLEFPTVKTNQLPFIDKWINSFAKIVNNPQLHQTYYGQVHLNESFSTSYNKRSSWTDVRCSKGQLTVTINGDKTIDNTMVNGEVFGVKVFQESEVQKLLQQLESYIKIHCT